MNVRVIMIIWCKMIFIIFNSHSTSGLLDFHRDTFSRKQLVYASFISRKHVIITVQIPQRNQCRENNEDENVGIGPISKGQLNPKCTPSSVLNLKVSLIQTSCNPSTLNNARPTLTYDSCFVFIYLARNSRIYLQTSGPRSRK